ncbi:MAG: apolipoprotein N-acyltransferase [Alphaproteobacteria bacterium]|nr:apolipoprotein N-acyltransferase [Alphaproteobacteria bacterium]
MKLSIFKSNIQSLAGFKRYALAFVLGALMVLAMPPFGAFPVLLISIPGMVWLCQGAATKTKSFLTGWVFGAGYFIFGLYWISDALFVDIQQFWWVLPLSLVIGPVIVALYYGFIPLLAWRYRKNDAAYALTFVTAFAAIEWVRGHAFTGFPWNLPGYAWMHVLPVMQTSAVTGIYGLTLLTLLWAAMPAFGKKTVLALLVSFLLVEAVGKARLMFHPVMQFKNYTVRIVQPDIAESFKWNRAEMRHNFDHVLALTSAPSRLSQAITFVIWPETALIGDLGQYPELAQYVAARLPDNSVGILGDLRNVGTRYYNSVSVLNKKAQVLDTYDKHHLVPFGEYIPFRKYIDMTPIAAGISGIGDFTRGKGVVTLDNLGNLPKPSPLICYEAIFPDAVALGGKQRPDWLVNVTNDAWYGMTTGPHQHFQSARVRAIEEGLPLVRAANTGISATVDPLGRIIGMRPLDVSGDLDTILPAPLPPTLYARYGDKLFFLMLIVLGVMGEAVYRKE